MTQVFSSAFRYAGEGKGKMGDLATLRRKISFLTRGSGENACQRTDQTEIPEASGDT